MPPRAPLVTLALAFALTRCTDPAPVAPSDAGPTDTGPVDAGPPQRITLADERARLLLDTGGGAGVRLRVQRPDGTTWFASPEQGSFVEVGLAPGGAHPTRLHDPRVPNPFNITWVTPTAITRTTGSDQVTLALGGGNTLSLRVTSDRAGIYRIACEGAGADVAVLRFHLAADDGGYHGLGERFGPVDARGSIVPMQFHVEPRSTSGTNEFHVPVPFFVSTRAYGMFVETLAPGAFDVASTDASRVSATFETRTAAVTLYTGEKPADVVAAYTRQTGLPRLPPRWAFGPMHWRNEWRSRDELMEDVRRIRAEAIPTTTVWIDNPWQRSYNDSEFDTNRFPDPPSLFQELQRMGFKVLVWSTPYLDAVSDGATARNTAEELFVQARDRGWLVLLGSARRPYVSVSNPGSAGGMSDANGALVDFTSRDASDFWTRRLEPLIDLGVRGFKLDYGEDVLIELLGMRTNFQFSNGENERTVHSTFPQLYHGAYRAALMRRANDDGFLLVRASSWGGQRVADIIWPGDLDNDFRRYGEANGRVQVGGLPAAVHALQSLAASGFPNFGSDTGGYRGGRPTREALLRWAEHSALTPILQLGGGGESHNPWSYDAEATRIYRDLARLHNDLVPYLRVHAIAASRDGTPPVQALGLAFPDDPAARADGEAYLLGDDLLVAPVVEAGATRRRVHLPSGTWVHWFTSEAARGPTDLDVEAPIGRPPLYVRQGAIIPMLAEAVVTLSRTDAADVVDEFDREAIVRARIVPAGTREVTLEDDTRLRVEESATSLTLRFEPGRTLRDLRAEIDLGHRGSGSAPPITIGAVTREGGSALTPVSDPAMVAAGCDGCWHYDARGATLRVGIRGSAAISVR